MPGSTKRAVGLACTKEEGNGLRWRGESEDAYLGVVLRTLSALLVSDRRGQGYQGGRAQRTKLVRVISAAGRLVMKGALLAHCASADARSLMRELGPADNQHRSCGQIQRPNAALCCCFTRSSNPPPTHAASSVRDGWAAQRTESTHHDGQHGAHTQGDSACVSARHRHGAANSVCRTPPQSFDRHGMTQVYAWPDALRPAEQYT